MKPLAIVPTFVRGARDMDLLGACLSSFRDTADGHADLLIVDDHSPGVESVRAALDFFAPTLRRSEVDLVARPTNDGFSKTVNVGLRRALDSRRDAILVNADIEFGLQPNWVQMMQRQQTPEGDRLASIVGGLLLYPNGTIQHAGIFFSMLYREFGHIYNHGPHNLPEALDARVCPVTGALQFIRWETLDELGLYDETFKMGWEDVDYCIRAWQAGLCVVYQPGVRAVHHESAFRGRAAPGSKIANWQAQSWVRFVEKYATTNFAEFIPNLV